MDFAALITLCRRAADRGKPPRRDSLSAAALYLSGALPAGSLILDCGLGKSLDATHLEAGGHRVLTMNRLNETQGLKFDAVVDVFTLPLMEEERTEYLEQVGKAVRPGGFAVFEFGADDRECRYSLLAGFEGWQVVTAGHTAEGAGTGLTAAQYVVFRKPLTLG